MSLRSAFASTLQALRAHRGLTQKNIANTTDPSHVSRLEAGTRSVSLEVSEELAHAIGIQPVSLITLVYASKDGMTAREMLHKVQGDLDALGLLDTPISADPVKVVHPRVAEAAELKRKILELMTEGQSQAQVARLLKVSPSTVTKHLKK
jgi:transcriptional regulator with XRE-family HTH domain